MSESDLSKNIQTTALSYKCKLFRNNSGAMKDFTGRQVRYGLGNISKKLWDKWKSSDLIGYTIVKIKPDMVGKEIAVFTAIEVKGDKAKIDERYHAQEKFIKQVKEDGGIGSMCFSVESLKDLFKDF